MPHSHDTEHIRPTTNMAGGNNRNGKKKVLVVGAGAAGTLNAFFEIYGS